MKIYKSNGSFLVEVPEQQIVTTACSLGLVGKGAANYGQTHAENFVHLLENFASPTPPVLPLKGQLWYDANVGALKVFDGHLWGTIPSLYDPNVGAGSAPIQIGNDWELALIAEGRIVAVICHHFHDNSVLPTNVEVTGQSLPFKARFPQGILPGINLAEDPEGYQFVGAFAGTAASALRLANTINLNIDGPDMFGSVLFNGGQDTTIITALKPSGVVPGTYTRIVVDQKGRVTQGSQLNQSDITSALGYTPLGNLNVPIQLTGQVTGAANFDGINATLISTTLSNTGVIPGVYNNVQVDAQGRVIAGSNVVYSGNGPGGGPVSITLSGDVTGTTSGNSGILPTTLSASGVVAGTYTKVTVDTKGRVTNGNSVTRQEILDLLGGLPTAPVGSVCFFAGQTAPDGWMERDGRELVRADFPELFAIIGTTFGAGNGTTTFNLPDDRGLFDRAWDHGKGNDPSRVFGSIQADEFKAHTHTYGKYAGSSPGSSPAAGNGSVALFTDTASGPAGGLETRPKNRAYLPIIKVVPANQLTMVNPVIIPPGTVAYFAAATAPAGWLKANGSTPSRTVFADLFAAIGTTFGPGDGSTTFGIPDLRGEFIRGFDDGRGVDTARVFGSAQGDLLRSHTHLVSAAPNQSTPSGGQTVGISSQSGGYQSGATGGAETRPRNVALLACIKY